MAYVDRLGTGAARSYASSKTGASGSDSSPEVSAMVVIKLNQRDATA